MIESWRCGAALRHGPGATSSSSDSDFLAGALSRNSTIREALRPQLDLRSFSTHRRLHLSTTSSPAIRATTSLGVNMFARRSLSVKALPTTTSFVQTQLRCLHAKVDAKDIPKPTPFVPDSQTFLTLIGRKMSQHAQKIPDWNALFSLSSPQLRELGVEPARSRRYLLHWRNKFRQGSFGIGGDLTDVQDGVGELKIVEVPAASGTATLTSSPGMRKIVVNVPAGQDKPSLPLDKVRPVQGTKVIRSNLISGPYVEAIKERPGTAKIVAKDGLWEIKRGHKIDGGERRKAEVRYKRRVEERKTTRG